MKNTLDYDFPFEGNYTFVDVEIPNLNNNCICAISMIVVEDHTEVLRHTELINPMTFFSSCNIKIHGIRRKDVLHSRTFPQFWKDYRKYFGEEYIIAAHNSMSDISVINKDLMRINDKIQAKTYIDTMDIMSDFYYKGTQKKGDLKLDNIAKTLGIYLDHHNPESDVNACYEAVRWMAQNQDLDIAPFKKTIPERKPKAPRMQAVPSANQMRKYLAEVKKQIALKDSISSVKRQKAEQRADKAVRHNDYEGAVLNFEIAIAKKSKNPTVYLKAADLYTSLNMNYEAGRVLEVGMRRLKKTGGNYYVLQRALNKLRKERKTLAKTSEADAQA